MKLDKFAWQKKLRGADLTKAEYCVLMNISTYTGPDLKGATMSVATIAADSRMDVRWAKRLIRSLQQKGYLKVTTAGGNAPGNTNTYEVTLPTRPEGVVTTTSPRGGETSHQGVVKRASMGGETSHQGVVAITPQPEYLPRKAPETAPEVARATDEFENWFSTYPRREGKDKARAAYAEAVKKTGPDVLLYGVQQYAVKVQATQRRFIKQPANWLNEELWRDCNLTKHTWGW